MTETNAPVNGHEKQNKSEIANGQKRIKYEVSRYIYICTVQWQLKEHKKKQDKT